MSMDTQHIVPARQWRAPALRLPRGLSAAWLRVLIPAAVVVVGVLMLLVEGHGLSWVAGLFAGAGVGIWLALRAGVPGLSRLSNESRPRPVRVERRTAETLESLGPQGWRFLHDVPGPDGSYDHIAVGHGGVILLESMNPQGVVTMQGGEPIVERRDDPNGKPLLRRLRPSVLTDATTVKETVHRLAGRRIWVQAVVVLWSEFPAGCVVDGRCVYIHGSRLAEWLSRRPHQLEPGQIEDVFADVAKLQEIELPLPVAV